MRWNPRSSRRVCRPMARSGQGPHAWPGTPKPPPDSAAERCPAGGPPGDGAVRVRFTPSDLPVLTRCPADRTAAIQGAAEALARLGRSYLGGSLEVTFGSPRRAAAADERLAAARAVENALRGGCGSVQVPPPQRWPAPPGCSGAGGCPCLTIT